MKLTYLGTAAAEGFPAVFCNCKHCKKARKLGGKNIRTRSQTLINDDLLIDLPADTYQHFLSNKVEGHKIKYLLVTHSHQDHFYMEELAMRHKPFAHNMETERIQVFANKGSYEKLKKMHGIEKFGIDYTEMKPYKPVTFGDYKVTGLPAHHFEGDGALIYIIEQNGKKVLYAHDTGYFYDEVFDYIKDNKIVFDMITLDCNHVDERVSDNGGHMGIENNERVVKKLTEMGAVTEKTQKFVNHFSHNSEPFQNRIEKMVKPMGFKVSYDGREVEI